MIQNLSAYSAWKRSTLNRLTDKYRREMNRILDSYLRRHELAFIYAFSHGLTRVHLPDEGIKADLRKLFDKHHREVMKVGVSDGIREVAPDKSLSTWVRWPVGFPVENTFVNLAERKQRDKIFDRLSERIYKRNQKIIGKMVEAETKRYLTNVQAIFKNIATSYYNEDQEGSARDQFLDVIKRSLQKTDSQSERIFRTETTRFFNDARVAYFQENTDVDFIQIIAVTDGRISNICEVREKYVVPLSKANDRKYKPPFHPNCRSVQSPLITMLKSDEAEVKRNLGVEFGSVHSETSDKDFVGKRPDPNVKQPLPDGWS